MINLITGVVGSGKTLFCIEELIKLKNGVSTYKDVDFIYSNIANFKHDFFEDSKYTSINLNMNLFYNHLKELYFLYTDCESKNLDTDSVLLKYCKLHKLYNCFVIFDEAHNFFDNQDKVKVWYLTYHRHLHHNIYMITQNKMLINTKYRQLPEVFIKALPQTKRIGKDFKYNTYAEFKMTDKVETITVKNREELFSLYTSGNFTKQKSFALKPLLYFIFSLVLVVFIFIFFYLYFIPSSDNSSTHEVQKESKQISDSVSTPVNVSPPRTTKPLADIDSDYKIIQVTYDSEHGFIVNNYAYSYEHFKNFLDNTDSYLLSEKVIYQIDKFFMKSYFLKTKDIYLSNYFIYEFEEEKQEYDNLAFNEL